MTYDDLFRPAGSPLLKRAVLEPHKLTFKDRFDLMRERQRQGGR